MPEAQPPRPLITPHSERQPSRDTVPFEAFDPTHPDHAWFVGDDPDRCRADKPCPVCDPPAVRALREAGQ